jgi:hypothetical protein
MFKKLVSVATLLLFAAGPVFAADTTAPSSDTSASAPAKSHKKHSHKKKSKSAASTDSSAPK